MPRSQKSNQKRKVWILIALLVVAGVITGVVLIVKNKDNSKKSDSYENMRGQSEQTYEEKCKECIEICKQKGTKNCEEKCTYNGCDLRFVFGDASGYC